MLIVIGQRTRVHVYTNQPKGIFLECQHANKGFKTASTV